VRVLPHRPTSSGKGRSRSLGSVLLVLLAIAWGVLLIPKLLQRNDGGFGVPNPLALFAPLFSLLNGGASRVFGRSDPLGRGHRGSRAVGLQYQRTHIPAAAEARARRAKKRRRDILFGLMASVIGTAVMALIPGLSVLWSANLIVDALLVGYVLLLIAVRNNAPARARATARPYGGADVQPIYAQGTLAPVSSLSPRRSSAAFFEDQQELAYAYARAANE
jgi:hypothetical protein